eukprot:scaffold29080_cov181-Isochrysis_galbana.AAC.1
MNARPIVARSLHMPFSVRVGADGASTLITAKLDRETAAVGPQSGAHSALTCRVQRTGAQQYVLPCILNLRTVTEKKTREPAFQIYSLARQLART